MAQLFQNHVLYIYAHHMCICTQNIPELKLTHKTNNFQSKFLEMFVHELLNEKGKVEIKYSEISYTKNSADTFEHSSSNSYLTMMQFCQVHF